MNIIPTFNSFAHMLQVLPDDQSCRTYLEQIRWNGIPVCPHCAVQDEKHYQLKTKGEFKGMYKCRSCKERFTVTIGTMFEGSPIPLRKWFIALYIFSSHKKGISSHQLARDLGVTQKTAWFMLHRLREAFAPDEPEQLEGVISIDETFIGGKQHNKSKSKRSESEKGSIDDKSIVFGAIEKDGEVFAMVVPNRQRDTLIPLVKKIAKKGSTIVTDEHKSYHKVRENYFHVVVNHDKEEYVKWGYSTNNMEGFWSLLKRGITGIYHQVSSKHLQPYCNEFAFRFNTRKVTDKVRFNLALAKTQGFKLEYKTLIAK